MTEPRLLSFIRNGKSGYGLAKQGGVVDLSARLGAKWPTMRNVIEAGALKDLFHEGQRHATDFSLQDVRFDIPVPDPEKLICVGVNFPDRNEEYKDGQDAPKNMSLFVRFPRSFVGHGESIVRPPESPQFDYEGEIVIIIGKGGRRIPESEALLHIAGLTLCNEGTLRDWVRHAKFNVTQGKNFDRSGSIGPWLVPYTHESQLADIRLTTRVNGELRQDDRTSRMIFPFRKIINYISTFTTLVPGDTIVCGTPTGAGARFDPPIWLKPGDVVEVDAEGVGKLSNTVADEVMA